LIGYRLVALNHVWLTGNRDAAGKNGLLLVSDNPGKTSIPVPEHFRDPNLSRLSKVQREEGILRQRSNTSSLDLDPQGTAEPSTAVKTWRGVVIHKDPAEAAVAENSPA